jgi:hypothetical protein
MIFARRSVGGRLWFYWFKFGPMRIVAVGTEIIGSFARPHKVSCSFAMNPGPPISILRAMTFTTEPIALGKVYKLPIIKS